MNWTEVHFILPLRTVKNHLKEKTSAKINDIYLQGQKELQPHHLF